MEYKNFFQSVKEAAIRLNGTLVLYDGQPVELIVVSDHVGDGVIRAYIRPVGLNPAQRDERPQPTAMYNFPPHSSALGNYMDEFIRKNPSSQIVRKRLDSPKFNKFRPFDLGMFWNPPDVYYVERQPNRITQQGLVDTMLVTRKVELLPHSDGLTPYRQVIDMFGPEMKRCILGDHPSPYRCLEALLCNKYVNKVAAFHRSFALLKGPADTIFLVYKSDVVGVLPNGDFSSVRLSRQFSYTREAVGELGLFTSII